MKTQLIILQDQQYFELSELAKYLADLCPAAPKSLQGLDCITRKLIPQFSLDKRPKFLYQKPFVPKQDLSDEDKKILGEILPNLPIVTNFMTYEQIDSFFDGYYKIDKRPRWEPDIMSPSDRGNMQRDYQRRLDNHCQRFADMAEKGQVKAIDSKFDIVSAKNCSHEYIKGRGLRVTKRDAVTFLSAYGLDVNFDSQTTVNRSEIIKRRPKADLLTAIIDDLYRKYDPNVEDNRIWLELTKMASEKTHPFTSIAKGLIFYEDQGSHSLTRKSLMARLYRRKKRA